ncbi:hypothetical protein QU481_15160 [Crenobacter sp. SG2303]|uniref:BcpO-related WXXGXW repeat protein n=1 Tax=Crenobacter oryzisoli TaxID=3056844 RepID=A0ABT7XRM4_9NEIS|nr:hypothetical protein [Crenobacter sp. SG2303]MDN0076224.1 hypothetical protein [Crenobacter sp. SG2303]
MRHLLIVLPLLLAPVAPSQAQVSINIGIPGLSIGINVPVYPDLVLVPGYPVYYAPGAPTNYFFYDGLYWVFQGDNWYQSSWYDGPWQVVGPEYVPVYLLRVPVRYYRYPPPYFRGWRVDQPPRWGDHWGRDWEEHRHGWEHWDRHAVPAAAPLPLYQRHYSGGRYPRTIEQQHSIRSQNYHYQPREAITRQSAPMPEHSYRPGPEQQRPSNQQYSSPQRYSQPGRPANEPYQPAPPPQHPQPQQHMPPNQPWQQQANPGRPYDERHPQGPGTPPNEPWQHNPGRPHGEPHQQAPVPQNQPWQQQGGPGRSPGEQRPPNRPQYQERNRDGERGESQQGSDHQRPYLQ